MKDTVLARGKDTITARAIPREPTPSGRMTALAEPAIVHLQLEYPVNIPQTTVQRIDVKMTVPVVGPIAEGWAVRLFVPGAIVAPEEQPLVVPGGIGQVTFSVTALAQGDLPDARVEMYRAGQFVQQIPIPMRSVSRSSSAQLLAAAVVIPTAILILTTGLGLHGSVTQMPLRDLLSPLLPTLAEQMQNTYDSLASPLVGLLTAAGMGIALLAGSFLSLIRNWPRRTTQQGTLLVQNPRPRDLPQLSPVSDEELAHIRTARV